MKNKKYILVITFLLLAESAMCNDSTLIYQQRLQKLKSLYDLLSSNSVNQIKHFPESIKPTNHTYDKVIDIYFDKHYLDSTFKLDTSFFAVSAKWEWVNLGIGLFANLSNYIPFDSIKFKPSEAYDKNAILSEEDRKELKNTISLYFKIDEKEIKYLDFTFFENNSKLYYLSTFGYDQESFAILSKYLTEHSIAKKKTE